MHQTAQQTFDFDAEARTGSIGVEVAPDAGHVARNTNAIEECECVGVFSHNRDSRRQHRRVEQKTVCPGERRKHRSRDVHTPLTDLVELAQQPAAHGHEWRAGVRCAVGLKRDLRGEPVADQRVQRPSRH